MADRAIPAVCSRRHLHAAACLVAWLALLHPGTGATATGSFGHYEPAPLYSERSSHTRYITLRDGVRLAVRVSQPARGGKPAEGRFPVIWHGALTVTEAAPTGIGGALTGFQGVPSLTRYGYIVVQVARRGNGQSLGVRRGYNDRTESDDAYEVTEWLASQPWSDGAVGVYGCSNTGDAAMHALTARAPHLRAAFAGCFSWSKYDAMHRGGIFAQWGTGPQRTVAQDMAVEPVEGDETRALLRIGAEEHQLSTNLFAMWQSLPFRDSYSPLVASRFWSEGSVASYAAQIRQGKVPLYIEGGWHDELRDQGIIAMLNIPGSRILIGPWQHCVNPGFELLQEIHRFFDTHLKGIDTGLMHEPRVHYFTINDSGSGAWHGADTWPVAGVAAQRLYLQPGGGLAAATAPGAFRDVTTVHVDLQCPGGELGPYSQPCHVAGEGLSYTSAALAQPLTLTGNPVVQLRIDADLSDANAFAYLEDLAPDGTLTQITEGRLRASLRAEAIPPFVVPGTPWHRAFAEDARPLAPGEAVTLHFDLMPTSYQLAAGHRLQLTITGADYRERDRDARVAGMKLAVSSTAAEMSYIDVPVLGTRFGR